MAGLGGQSTMRRRAGLRQGHICAILLSLGKELMRFNGPCALRADLLTPTCPLRLTHPRHTQVFVRSSCWRSI